MLSHLRYSIDCSEICSKDSLRTQEHTNAAPFRVPLCVGYAVPSYCYDNMYVYNLLTVYVAKNLTKITTDVIRPNYT